jgi:peptidoglycan biosynthesis protein MviN/MurJ (putative lipid II flippase)
LPISRNQLKIISIIATILGIYGMVIFVQINSPIFLLTSIANLALAAFFWYKYRKKNEETLSKKGKRV